MKISWEDAVKYSISLAEQVKNYCPEVIIGIGRGSLVLTCLIAEYLNIKNTLSIPVVHYSDDRKELDKVYIGDVSLPIKNKRVLLVDDICDTGKTLRDVRKYCMKFEPKSVHTAVMLVRTDKEHVIEPHYFAKGVTEWCEFCWELKG